jgi:hypothetical protein
MALKSIATQKKQGLGLTPVISGVLQNRPIRHTRFVSSYWGHEAEALPGHTKTIIIGGKALHARKTLNQQKYRTKI